MYINSTAVSTLALSSRGLPDGHPFVAAADGDSRAPCPALNSLANHGFINHNGKGIHSLDLISALKSVYHLSTPLATTLTTAGFLCCGSLLNGLDLHDLAKHNKIEHDASLVHDDANGAEFAPVTVNQDSLNALVQGHDGGLTLDDLAKARAAKEKALKTPLDSVHEEIGHGEAGLTFLLLKDENGLIPVEDLKTWYGKESLPEGRLPPADEISLETAKEFSSKVGDSIGALD